MIQKSFACFMAVVLVLSTTSFSVHKHFCGSFLVDVSIVVPSSGCGMEQDLAVSTCEVVKSVSCCSDKQELVQGQDTLKMDFFAFAMSPFYTIPQGISWFFSPVVIPTLKAVTNLANAPPETRRQLYILHDSFLI